jgi:hypothetical protein
MDNESVVDEPLFPGEYTPDWIEDIGLGCSVGITIDGGCLMVLTRDPLGYWEPTSHIPPAIARRLGEIAEGVAAPGSGPGREHREPAARARRGGRLGAPAHGRWPLPALWRRSATAATGPLRQLPLRLRAASRRAAEVARGTGVTDRAEELAVAVSGMAALR